MRHTKRFTSAVLAMIMVLTMMLSAAMIPATAAEGAADDLSNNLLIHYTFDKMEAYGNQYAIYDQASAGEADDYLIMAGSGIASEGDSGKWGIPYNFVIENGTITPTDHRAALRAANSSDINTLQSAESDSTWFVRFKIDGFAREGSDVAAHAVYLGSYAYSTPKPAKPFTLTVMKSNLQYGYHRDVTTLKTTWSEGQWLNAAMVRSYNGEDYTYTCFLYDDALNKLYTSTSTGALDTNGDEIISLFRMPHAGGYAGSEAWSGDTGLSLDDVRAYNTALSEDELRQVVNEFTNPLLHYDFKGDDVFANKGTSGATDDLIKNNDAYTIENGVIKSTAKDFAMRLEASETTKDIQTGAVTWFFRAQMPESSADGDRVLVDFRRTGGGTLDKRPLWIALNSSLPQIAVDSANATAAADLKTDPWQANAMSNLALVRSYKTVNGTTTTTSTMYAISDDGLTVTEVYTWNNAPVQLTDETNIGIAFFLQWDETSENVNKYSTTWTNASGMSYDDIRCYNTALTTDQLSDLVVSEFGDDVINIGLQKGVGTNEGNKVRLVAQIRGADYDAAGFKVTATWDGKTDATPVDLPCNFAYTSLAKEDEDGTIGAITPATGYYLIAVIVDDIPTNLQNVTLTFTPYADTYEGKPFTYNVSTGAYVE